MRARLTWVLPEGAVPAIIAAKRGQRNENLLGKRNDSSLPPPAHLAGNRQQLRERCLLGQNKRSVAIQGSSIAATSKEFARSIAIGYGRGRRCFAFRLFRCSHRTRFRMTRMSVDFYGRRAQPGSPALSLTCLLPEEIFSRWPNNVRRALVNAAIAISANQDDRNSL